MFIAIEGDNATGKTTLGKMLQTKGFELITEHQDIKKIETDAKALKVGSKERIEAFFAYNKECGEKAKQTTNSVLVRYWVSSVAAAYADGAFSINEALAKVEECIQNLPKPNFYFRLICSREHRLQRIQERRIAKDYSDDTSCKREIRYTEILDTIDKKFNLFTVIDSSQNSIEEVVEIVENRISGRC